MGLLSAAPSPAGRAVLYFYEMVQERFNLSDEQMLNYFGEKPELPSDDIVTEGKKWG